MKIILAPDKFKGSLTAQEVCQAMAEGILQVKPKAEIVILPMADGGEGTCRILTENLSGRFESLEVSDPLGRPVIAQIGLVHQKAFIEMASASGLHLLSPQERNPLIINTFGAGQLLESVINRNMKKIVLGIGGSATNDAGTGMASALGWTFLDKNHQKLKPCGGNLLEIDKIIPPKKPIQLPKIEVACDVNAPLFGINGAAYMYAAQKGATPQMIETLDQGLRHLAMIVERDFGQNLADVLGAGAAGGMGFGAMFFLNATLKSGIEIVLEQSRFDEHLKNADLVLTGEGKIDAQTLQGKLIAGIVKATKIHNVPVIALCGTLDLSADEVQQLGLDYATSILTKPLTLAQAILETSSSIKESTALIMRLLAVKNTFSNMG